ncbi:glutamyl-tRNA(Gln) amidotransferase subunit B, mitochondrial [Ctenocephalides felis]|uniref:glutamyl-tRNA(Gln) amidotransferase subunit B, mitochondrial n=1 Tax=Ctenocephalides felis TaxID=7515 RepID=UPI000E6E3A5F|nr:glutamyl-tRNA(Gln) amidotransferase subunit B, mitochondrial [Ctenocephalides felis]
MSVLYRRQLLYKYKRCVYGRSKSTSSQSNKSSDWVPTIGLEVHAQISSKSKLFSGASTDFSSPVNNCVSFFDAAIPGTLPVLNQKCVESGIRTALALNCSVHRLSMFERKHYFYADLPSGYQITQQRKPLASNGFLEFYVDTDHNNKKIKRYKKASKLLRIQLEQDSGRSLHDEYENKSLVDLNRAGIPLMELVFNHDLNNGEEAASLVKELVAVLQALNTCNCKMEEGALRVDANVSLSKPQQGDKNIELGIRTEIKNIGSIRGVANAIKYEINRQKEILNSGGKIVNETRAWDAAKKITVAMREKEDRHDYRFMPEPNLPPLILKIDSDPIHSNQSIVSSNDKWYKPDDSSDLINVLSLKATLPELPHETRSRLVTDYNLTPELAITLVDDSKLLSHFLYIAENTKMNPMKAAKFLINELLTVLNKNKIEIVDSPITKENLTEILNLLHEEKINSNTAKLLLQYLIEDQSKTPIEIMKENNWVQISDEDELTKICQEIIEQNPKLVKLYKGGKKKVLFALLGDISKKTENRANMSKVSQILENMLK